MVDLQFFVIWLSIKLTWLKYVIDSNLIKTEKEVLIKTKDLYRDFCKKPT